MTYFEVPNFFANHSYSVKTKKQISEGCEGIYNIRDLKKKSKKFNLNMICEIQKDTLTDAIMS